MEKFDDLMARNNETRPVTYCYHGNSEGWCRNKYTSMHGHRKRSYFSINGTQVKGINIVKG